MVISSQNSVVCKIEFEKSLLDFILGSDSDFTAAGSETIIRKQVECLGRNRKSVLRRRDQRFRRLSISENFPERRHCFTDGSRNFDCNIDS